MTQNDPGNDYPPRRSANLPWVATLAGIAAAALTYVLLTSVLGARAAEAPLQDL